MRSRLAAAALVLAAACGGGDDDPAGSSTVTSVGPGATSTTGAGGEPGQPTTPGEAPTTPSTVASGAAIPDTSGPPGSAAAFYLRPQPATSIVLELASERGAEPSSAALEHLRSTFGEVSGKTVGTAVRGGPAARETWTADQLREAADGIEGVPPQGDTAVLQVLFVHGDYAESDTVLGVAVRADVIAIFADHVDSAASPLVGSDAIESAVLVHELGHVLGLVDLHRDTGRDDPEHPGHSTSRGSVMYWAVESTLVADLLTGGPPREFDAADLADLNAIRAGA
jgi:hypothetical protein